MTTVATSTAIVVATTPAFTVTPTPLAGGSCGNGFLEPGENFLDPDTGLVGDPDGRSCPEDAQIMSCEAAKARISFDVSFSSPAGTSPSSVTVLVGYKSDRVSLPGSGLAITVRQRLTTPPPLPFILSPNDLDYALRLVLARNGPLGNGLLFGVAFDACSGAAPPAANDFGCVVEGCAGAGGPVGDCTCTVSGP